MAYETKDNSGSVFPNEKKEKDSHPDWQGSCVIDGVEYWVSEWNKVAESGRKWKSLAFKRKEVKQAPKPAAKPSKPPHDDSEIPW